MVMRHTEALQLTSTLARLKKKRWVPERMCALRVSQFWRFKICSSSESSLRNHLNRARNCLGALDRARILGAVHLPKVHHHLATDAANCPESQSLVQPALRGACRMRSCPAAAPFLG